MQATVKAGGQELRLVPGRRMVIVTAAGEREVAGRGADPGHGIDQLLAGVLTPEAGRGPGRGAVAWRFDVPGVGTVLAPARRRETASYQATFTRRRRVAAADPLPRPRRCRHRGVAAVPAAPAESWTSSSARMFEMNASDLHISVGSPPMVRHDGEIKSSPAGPS